MNRNNLKGIVGSALACGITEVALNLIVNGTAHIANALIAGLVLGAVVGCVIALVGSTRTILVGISATAAVYAAIICAFAAASNSVIRTPLDAAIVTVVVAAIGLVNGLGYRFFSPKNN
jgi:hypothetical protein